MYLTWARTPPGSPLQRWGRESHEPLWVCRHELSRRAHWTWPLLSAKVIAVWPAASGRVGSARSWGRKSATVRGSKVKLRQRGYCCHELGRRKDFFQGRTIADFSRGDQKWCISFCPLETFCKRKMYNFKFKASPATFYRRPFSVYTGIFRSDGYFIVKWCRLSDRPEAAVAGRKANKHPANCCAIVLVLVLTEEFMGRRSRAMRR